MKNVTQNAGVNVYAWRQVDRGLLAHELGGRQIIALFAAPETPFSDPLHPGDAPALVGVVDLLPSWRRRDHPRVIGVAVYEATNLSVFTVSEGVQQGTPAATPSRAYGHRVEGAFSLKKLECSWRCHRSPRFSPRASAAARSAAEAPV